MTKLNKNKVYGAIANRETFQGHSAMSGERFDPPTRGTYQGSGRLSDSERAIFMACEDIVYIVRSYATPIAWEDSKGNVHLVEEKFSSTTSCHQGIASLGMTNREYSLARSNGWR